MNEKSYEKIKSYVDLFQYGRKMIKILNKITTLFVYCTYPIFLMILLLKGDYRFLRALIVPGVSFVLLSVFRRHINLPRPYELLNIQPIINKSTKGKSFPSRHVFSVFVIAMTIYYVSKPTGILLMFIGLIIAIIRVVGGVHFPRDVIAGAIVGIVCSLIGWNLSIF